MKEVPNQDLPDISGGDFNQSGCIPYPRLPSPDDGINYPQNPFNPVIESPYTIEE